jgi:hypothetical protein
MKMDLTEGSETSAKLNLTPGKYPKENIQPLPLVCGKSFQKFEEKFKIVGAGKFDMKQVPN